MNQDQFRKEYWDKNWIKRGLGWGIFMFVIMGVIYPFVTGIELNFQKIIFNLVTWLIAGLLWGYIMKWWMNRQANKESNG